MSDRSETVGEAVDRRGLCALMAAVVELAEARKRIPVGHWRVDLGNGYELEVNGTSETVNSIAPWESMIYREGLPLASFNAAGGIVLSDSEDYLIDIIKQAAYKAEAHQP